MASVVRDAARSASVDPPGVKMGCLGCQAKRCWPRGMNGSGEILRVGFAPARFFRQNRSVPLGAPESGGIFLRVPRRSWSTHRFPRRGGG